MLLFSTLAYERVGLLWRQRASKKSKVSVKAESKHNNVPTIYPIQDSSTGSVTYRNRILSDTVVCVLRMISQSPLLFFVILWPPFDPNIDRGMAVREYLVLAYVTLIYSGRIQSVSEMSGHYLKTKLYKYIVHTILFKKHALSNSSESIVGYRRAVKEYRVKWSNHLSIKNHKSCFLRNTVDPIIREYFVKYYSLSK